MSRTQTQTNNISAAASPRPYHTTLSPSPQAISAAAATTVFLSKRCYTRRTKSGSSHTRLALRLKNSSRRLRFSARRLSVRCKTHLSFIVAALHSATLHTCLRLSFGPHHHPAAPSPARLRRRRVAHTPAALPAAQTMCQSPIPAHDEHLVARFDTTESSDATTVDDIPTSPKCDDPPSPPCFHEPDTSLISRTLTLYDWDDTFFPSTFLAARGVRIDENDQLPQTVLDELEELEAIVIKILQEALRCGVVKVITNAEEGWVELSGSRFMPKLTDFLKANQIKIVSARTMYEAEFPDSPSCWKTAAFAAEVEESYPDADELNVLVLGDSLSEREAAHNLALRKPTSYVKSVKLVERPNVTQLRRQIALLHGSFHELREHYGSFDVNLTC